MPKLFLYNRKFMAIKRLYSISIKGRAQRVPVEKTSKNSPDELVTYDLNEKDCVAAILCNALIIDCYCGSYSGMHLKIGTNLKIMCCIS
jgi:hypothetical protein